MTKDFGLMKIDGKKLADEIVRHGLTKRGISREMGFCDNYVCKIINRGTASKSALMLIEKMYGIAAADIVLDGSAADNRETAAVESKQEEHVDQIDYDRLYETIKRAMIDALNA